MWVMHQPPTWTSRFRLTTPTHVIKHATASFSSSWSHANTTTTNNNNKPTQTQSNHNQNHKHTKWIRLSKRMSELNLCSRREADHLIQQNRVMYQLSHTSTPNLAVLGDKVPPHLTDLSITILPPQNDNHHDPTQTDGGDGDGDGDRESLSAWTLEEKCQHVASQTVVLHKPKGYVSGQAEHGHIPAVRLLTLDHMMDLPPHNSNNSEKNQTQQAYRQTNTHPRIPNSWQGYAPAGRLDLDSTGLLLLTKSGLLAKLLTTTTRTTTTTTTTTTRRMIDKEYQVTVQPAQQITRKERALGLQSLPPARVENIHFLTGNHNRPTTTSSSKRRRKTLYLSGDPKPLLPPISAYWKVPHEILHITLMEGRKHQVKRMCRELLGYHVTRLERVRIGPLGGTCGGKEKEGVDMGMGMPEEGQWRFLTGEEVQALLTWDWRKYARTKRT